ncbi:MAG TPA: LacI family DNA-binding transcriptional regulator [Actinomycetota bacterium]|nr:LacI family DNA-binding transcriptional regulator [Actinomycetota bacterium]
MARLAAVSPATVTRVLQGRESVRPETRRRVEEAIEALGYRPDHIARALVTRSSATVGLLLPSSGDSFWGEVAAGIEERASERGFSVLFANAHGNADRELAMIEVFLAKRVDGIIVAGAAGDPARWFRHQAPELPVVLVNWDARFSPQDVDAAQVGPPDEMAASIAAETMRAGGFSHIAFDDLGASRMLVDHLVGLGHRRIAFLGAMPIRPSLLRLLGVRQALGAAGLRPDPVIPCEETLEAGHAAAAALLERPEAPTAVIAYSDLVAIGVIRGLHAAGVRVPEDVSVVGYDDIEVAAFVEPPLTTVRQPKVEMGRRAMDRVLGTRTARSGPLHEVLPGELIVRASTAPPPAGRDGR